MPFQKLLTIKKFSPLRIKQLFDDCRLEAAHYANIKKGMVILQNEKKKTLLDCIKRYSKLRGLLIALGYPLKSEENITDDYKEMLKLAQKSIDYYYRKYNNKVAKA